MAKRIVQLISPLLHPHNVQLSTLRCVHKRFSAWAAEMSVRLVNARVHEHLHSHTQACVHTPMHRMHTCSYICARMHLHTCTCTPMHTCMHASTHKHPPTAYTHTACARHTSVHNFRCTMCCTHDLKCTMH